MPLVGPSVGTDPRLDPLRYHLRQSSRTTCGSASLLVARMLADPGYAGWILEGVDDGTGAASDEPVQERFGAAERTVKDRTNALLGPVGVQPPWPHGLGTPPWGAAHEMTRITGLRYRARYVGPDSLTARTHAYDAVDRTVDAGRTAPMFVGDRAVPRHVVLAVGRDDDALRVYEPASGDVLRLTREQYLRGGFVVAGWAEPWAVVVPR